MFGGAGTEQHFCDSMYDCCRQIAEGALSLEPCKAIQRAEKWPLNRYRNSCLLMTHVLVFLYCSMSVFISEPFSFQIAYSFVDIFKHCTVSQLTLDSLRSLVSDHQKLEREARICRLLKHPNIGKSPS